MAGLILTAENGCGSREGRDLVPRAALAVASRGSRALRVASGHVAAEQAHAPDRGHESCHINHRGCAAGDARR